MIDLYSNFYYNNSGSENFDIQIEKVTDLSFIKGMNDYPWTII